LRDPKDDIEKLSKGKGTYAKIGSRDIPHRLTLAESTEFNKAKSRGYLKWKNSYRVNLENVYRLYCRTTKRFCLIIRNNGEFPTTISEISKENLISKRSVKVDHWDTAVQEDLEYIFPQLDGYYSSFFKFWKAGVK